MRYMVAVLVCVLVGCGAVAPAKSPLVDRLNGIWRMEENATPFVFDLRAGKITTGTIETAVTVERTEGYTVTLRTIADQRVITARFVSDDVVEWTGEPGTPPIRLLRQH
jgi:hypothetical protein